MWKKKLATVVSLVTVFSVVLAGCGGGSKDEGSSASGSDKKDKPYQLVWYQIGDPQKDTDKVVEKINEYTKEKINATVDLKMIGFGDYSKKMQVITASGEPYDIAFTSSWANDYLQNVAKGAFVELDDLLDSKGQGIVKALDPKFIEGAKVNGKIYGIPTNKEVATQRVFRFNKQFVDKYNLDISNVNSLESLEPILKTFKEKEGYAPLWGDKNTSPYLAYDFVTEKLPMAIPFGSTDYKVVNFLDQPDTMKTFETLHKYYKAGYLPADIATSTNSDYQKNGKWLVDMADSQPYADLTWSRSTGYDIVSKPAGEAIATNTSVLGSMMAISSTSENPEKAMEFLNLLNTDPYLRNLVDMGIEGTHYKKNADGTVTDLPAAKDYDMPSFALGNEFILNLYDNDPKDKWEQFKKFNADAKSSPLLGFHFDPSKVQTEMAALKNVSDEYMPALMTGTVDPKDYIAKADQKFKAAGLDTVMAEVQKQIDEWKAAQGK
ncbi:ABC transporter substrate-binding protein [Paenibacillus chibensis]|uniref:ABC transporter substrate-binding protein n=1 Tax=Paenibacillus chibensis TaxID=59846 RepID=A0ABU6PV09_9BACL|nr:ABC transporter substrate-binding protein [Paenibacillus chibensis]